MALQKCSADMDSIQRMQSLADNSAKTSIWKRCAVRVTEAGRHATAEELVSIAAGRWSR